MADEPEETGQPEDNSEEMDTVPVFSSSNHDAEMEALNLHALLESNGIPSIVVGPSTIPSLEFQVQVPQAYAEEARRAIEEARAAGPAAAAEAEEASESGV